MQINEKNHIAFNIFEGHLYKIEGEYRRFLDESIWIKCNIWRDTELNIWHLIYIRTAHQLYTKTNQNLIDS